MAAMISLKSSVLIARTADTLCARPSSQMTEEMAIDWQTTDAFQAACLLLATRMTVQAVNSINLTIATRALASVAVTTAKRAADGRACTATTMP
ncbi:hypothetical protein BC831DRAFT_25416 [Entophlyctis helioformis]|nr:hypothetical protein BC831DRAFT_25416 [Entophlyctis helioformis]